MKKCNSNIFLPHLHDPFRQKIALNFAKEEMRKLLPNLRKDSLWRSIDSQIEKWPNELTIRNFWNAIHGISIGFRLKSLVPWITSLNVYWEEKEIPVLNLWFGGRFGAVKQLGVPESAAEVKKTIFKKENKAILVETQKITKEKAKETAPRDHFPIFVVSKKEKLVVIDGNRRLMSAVVNGKEKILAVIGEPIAEPPLYEHWVPTSLLVDLVFWYKREVQAGRDTTKTMAQTIAEIIRNSSAGRIEFKERAVHRNDEIHLKLLEAVADIFSKWKIEFEV
jgi:hypothetical protein